MKSNVTTTLWSHPFRYHAALNRFFFCTSIWHHINHRFPNFPDEPPSHQGNFSRRTREKQKIFKTMVFCYAKVSLFANPKVNLKVDRNSSEYISDNYSHFYCSRINFIDESFLTPKIPGRDLCTSNKSFSETNQPNYELFQVTSRWRVGLKMIYPGWFCDSPPHFFRGQM